MSNFIDLTGKKYGRLYVISRAENKVEHSGRIRIMWNCKCECGITAIIEGHHLRTGHTKSCGCITKKHSMFGTRIYKIWENVKRRCLNPNSDAYKDYGGRGITVCEEWREFIPFYEWSMNNGYSDDLTIDRIDVNGNYEPTNCRWADNITQHNNTRTNRHIEYNGEVHTTAEWARITGINYATLKSRLFKYNWSVERALTEPIELHNRK